MKVKMRRKKIRLPLAVTMLVFFLSFSAFSFASDKCEKGMKMLEDQLVSRNVRGHIIGATGEPMIGVNVVEAGTTNGVVSDIDGNYMIILTTNNPILNISYIGFKTQTINVGNRSVIN